MEEGTLWDPQATRSLMAAVGLGTGSAGHFPQLSLFWLPPCDGVLTSFLVIQLFEPCLEEPTFFHAAVH